MTADQILQVQNTYRKLAFLTVCQKNLEDDFGWKVSVNELDKIVGSAMDDEWQAFNYYKHPDTGLDTCVRESLYELTAQHLVGESWPRYSDPEETTKLFYKNVIAAAEANGWKETM